MTTPTTLPTMTAQTLPVPAIAVASSTFAAIGATCRILVTDAAALVEARAIAQDHLAALDLAASRFRPDSEVSRLVAGGRTAISDLLADHVAAALQAAQDTDGLLDPTVGQAVLAAGYDEDIALVRQRVARSSGRAAELPGWEAVRLDGATLTLPPGTLLDLGATAKAHAADRIARTVADVLGVGVLVELGGDCAVAGPAPRGGWRVSIEAEDGRVLQVVATTGAAITTSSTQRRRWRTAEGEAHHIIDPRTGRPARTRWAQVTTVAPTALAANTASTAAIVLGDDAPAWLTERGTPALLLDRDGSRVVTPGWPEDLS